MESNIFLDLKEWSAHVLFEKGTPIGNYAQLLKQDSSF